MVNKYIFILLFSTTVYSQNIRLIDTTDYEFRKSRINTIKTEKELFKSNLKKKFKGKLKKEIIGIYDYSFDSQIKDLRRDKFIFDKRFVKYSDSIKKVIKNKIPEIDIEKLKIFISKSPDINAVNVSKNIIYLNIGLFNVFKTEKQFFSVLLHEIAHNELNHVDNTIIKSAKIHVSKDKKELFRSIRQQKYNQHETSFNALKDLLYSNAKIYRKREVEADSLGYLFYKKIFNNYHDYTSSLKLIANYKKDTIKLDSTVYKTFFNLPEHSFKETWLSNEEFSKYKYGNFKEKISEDSIKSHPEFLDRIEKLIAIFPEIKENVVSEDESSKFFLKLIKLSKKEVVVSLYDTEKIGESILLCLHVLSKQPNNLFYKQWLGINFTKLYESKKQYRLNRYIERINPEKQNANYQQFLNFIWNLSLQDLEEIAKYYTETVN